MQYTLLGGRCPVVVSSEDVPRYVPDLIAYSRAILPYAEPDLFQGMKLQLPSAFSKNIVLTEDKLTDILRGRRPQSDLASIVREWRSDGGDETRAFLEKALAASS
jgi:putative aldouronate transport system substrate-binding protein